MFSRSWIAGAAGYLVKNAADRELADAVRAVASGDVYVQPSASIALARAMSRRSEHADERERFERLTERISEKLGLTHRADYVQMCLRLGLLQPKS